jgi:hypothetical protein
MRVIRYKTHGAVGWDSWKHGSLTELLFDIPHLWLPLRVFKVIPPFHVLNEILISGISEAGMSGGCRWQPFQISEEEYAELVEDLITLPGADLSIDSELQGSKNLEEWKHRRLGKYRKEHETGSDSR